MSYAIQADEPSGLAPAALSALVHIVLLAMLVFGLHWQSRHPDAVQVELWSQLPEVESPPKVEPRPEPKVEPKPEAKPPLKLEQQIAKPDIAIEREKKKKKEDAALKFDNTQRIREQLAQEQKALQAREKQDAIKQFATPVAGLPDAGYIDKIRTAIKQRIVLPSEIKGNPEAIFEVIQIPTGQVISVKLVKSSGHQLYDDAVERAIRGALLPKPDRPEQFRRELQLKFRPFE